jgi:Fur family zinc uptake transcriptional regulator
MLYDTVTLSPGEALYMTPAFAAHDHSGCIARAVAAVEAICAVRGLRLTVPRRRALEILLEGHRALGAYEVLARMSAEGLGAHPPVAYRALDFLVEHGFAHRIEGLNAFVACPNPDSRHRPAFMVCRRCRAVAESEVKGDMDVDGGPLGTSASQLGFRIERTVVEAEGVCPACCAAEAR